MDKHDRLGESLDQISLEMNNLSDELIESSDLFQRMDTENDPLQSLHVLMYRAGRVTAMAEGLVERLNGLVERADTFLEDVGEKKGRADDDINCSSGGIYKGK